MVAKELEDWEVRKICWENEIYVIQKPISSNWKKGGQPVKLIIDYKNQFSKGKETYEQNSKELENKINEVYRFLYENNIK